MTLPRPHRRRAGCPGALWYLPCQRESPPRMRRPWSCARTAQEDRSGVDRLSCLVLHRLQGAAYRRRRCWVSSIHHARNPRTHDDHNGSPPEASAPGAPGAQDRRLDKHRRAVGPDRVHGGDHQDSNRRAHHRRRADDLRHIRSLDDRDVDNDNDRGLERDCEPVEHRHRSCRAPRRPNPTPRPMPVERRFRAMGSDAHVIVVGGPSRSRSKRNIASPTSNGAGVASTRTAKSARSRATRVRRSS